MSQRRKLRIALLACLVALSPALVAAVELATGNVREVEPGLFFRSGQLSGAAVEEMIQRNNIMTILNLRGAHPQDRWYAAESSVAEGYGVKYISIPLSPSREPDMAEMNRIAALLRQAHGPILVHCNSGANRAGLVSAIYELAVQGKSAAEASGQLSIFYGHFPWFGSKTAAMDRAFQNFAAQWDPNTGRAVAQNLRPNTSE
jgi:protein tyrosine/serine phosphatase